MSGLFEFTKWFVEVVYTGEVANEWYYQMIGDYDTLQEFLAVLGMRIIGFFG